MNHYYKFIILFSLSVTLLFAGMSSGTAGYVFKPKGYDGQLYDFFLPNGMKAIMMEKHSSPHVAVNIYYNVGSRDDPKGQKGITNIISKLYKMDSKNYTSNERNRILTTLNAEHGLVYDQDIFFSYPMSEENVTSTPSRDEKEPSERVNLEHVDLEDHV